MSDLVNIFPGDDATPEYLNGWRAGFQMGNKVAHSAEIERLRAALEAIQWEAERENGGLVHMKRCIAVQARQALKGPTDE